MTKCENGQPSIPGAGHNGYSEWALYKGEKVTDAYLANNLYGQAVTHLGLSLGQALFIADRYYKYQHGENAWDQPEDQAAIISGYYEATTGNPWPKGLMKPVDFYHLEKNNKALYNRIGRHFKDFAIIKSLVENSKGLP